jgi:hypothetical protein
MGKLRIELAEICHELIVYLNAINDFRCCVYLQRTVYFVHTFGLRVSCNYRNKRPSLSYTALTDLSQQWKRSDFQASSQNCVTRLLTSCLPYLRLFVHMEHLGFHWTDFHEIWYFVIFLKSVGKIQVSLKSNKNSRYLMFMDPCMVVWFSRNNQRDAE